MSERVATPATNPVPKARERHGPLVGVRVIELGQMLAGPYCGSRLADFGAEVIKVEPPGKPDVMRQWGQHRYRGRGLWWPVLSRNKKCITLDLRQPEGQAVLKRLVEHADVLLENFRPGTLEAWRLGPDVLQAINPRLIIARVSGYGQTGPYAGRAGFASVSEAMGGIRYINGFPDQPPPRMGISLGDSLAALFATEGILMALYWRDGAPRAGPNGQRGSGRGQIIDATITESCFALLESAVPDYDKLGVIRGPGGTKLPGIAPSNIYRSRDGKWMVIGANLDTVFRRLCQVMGRPELADDPRYATHTARGEHQDELDAIVGEWAAQHDAAEIDRVLNEAGVVCGPIYTIADIFRDPQFQAREMIRRVEDPVLGDIAVPGIVPKLSETPGDIEWLGPDEMGSHNQEVYGGLLGLTDAELEDLRGRGVI